MIDTRAVVADVVALLGLTREGQSASPEAYLAWVGEQTQQLPVTMERNEAGSVAFTLPGKMSQTVVLGSNLAGAGEQERLATCLSLVVGVETIKALAHRYGEALPCGVQLRVWTESAGAGVTGDLGQGAAAYLELEIEAGTEMQRAGMPLAVVDRVEGTEQVFHPRLRALCDEAIRELTGTSAGLVAGPARQASAVASRGVPAAVLCVQSLDGFADGQGTEASRLHLLQAAEAFGRWAEATVHVVVGEDVFLWAREDRVPHHS